MGSWYRNAVIYSLHVEAFKDADGDGVGDFAGLNSAVDYLASLGVTCLWLLPFYPSPLRDNGYDVSDYYNVHRRYGTLGDFVRFLEHAESHNIKVLIDMPANHTSTAHPWFQEAREDPSSPYRDFYYWSESRPDDMRDNPVFGEAQEGNWTYDERAGAYYYHTFYAHQPDLNYTNPRVLEEMKKVLGFWLRLGVAGFRLDAVPHMLRAKGNSRFEGDPHDLLRGLRRFVEGQRPEAVLLGEVDVEPQEMRRYFGREDQLHVLLNFYLCSHLFLAFASGSGEHIRRALEALPLARPLDQYGYFLRNHDELDLERLSERERQRVYEAFAPEEEMRIFGRGIRRRLAPMLCGDRRRIELAQSLLLTLPGTPVLRYGQEIGMGEDLSLPGRDSVRTVMQWTSGEDAGFSAAPREAWCRPLVHDGRFGNADVNVADQRRDPDSLLQWTARAIRTRLECPEFGLGELRIVETGDPSVFAHRCVLPDSQSLAVHNLSDETKTVVLDLSAEEAGLAQEMISDSRYEPPSGERPTVGLEPYGYRWFRIEDPLRWGARR